MKTVVIRPQHPWYSDDLFKKNLARRKAERKWRSSRSHIDFEVYKEIKNTYNQDLFKAQCAYYNEQILDCNNDSKSLFRVLSDLLHTKKPFILPDHADVQQLANRFADYFKKKIDKIMHSLSSGLTSDSDSLSDIPVNTVVQWASFSGVNDESVHKIILKSPTKSCILDPMPTWMIKDQLELLLPATVRIINASIETGEVSKCLKNAVVTPLLKKASLDRNILKNYRPVSNLPFMSKTLERVVARQLADHMNNNNLHEPLQSAYTPFHNTETALLKVHNDILSSMDNQGITIFILFGFECCI